MGDQNWDGGTAFKMMTAFSRLYIYIVVVGRIMATRCLRFNPQKL